MRNWREFNDEWRDREGELAFDDVSTILETSVLVAEKIIKRIEPLGILLAVIGLAISIYSFQIDYADRTIERKLRAWEIITSEGPVNGGKREALEFLMSSGMDLSAAKLSGADLEGRDLSGFDLQNVDFSGARLSGANFQGANLNSANLREAILYQANLERARLNRANLERARIDGANLNGAFLIGANLAEAYLARADLRNGDFIEANLEGAIFREASLLGSTIWHANVKAADLRWSKGFSQDELNSACGDSDTKLPEGLTIPLCSNVDWFVDIHGDG